MKKGIAMSTLGYLILAVVILLILISFIMGWSDKGENFLSSFFRVLRK